MNEDLIVIYCIRKSILLRTLIHKKRDSVGYPLIYVIRLKVSVDLHFSFCYSVVMYSLYIADFRAQKS